METKNEEKLFIKCPVDGKVILVTQCYKCEKLFQVKIDAKAIRDANIAIVECAAGKTMSTDPKIM